MNSLALISVALMSAPDLPVLESPFCHVTYSEDATDYLGHINDDIRIETWKRVPDSAKRLAPVAASPSKDRRRGVLLYFARDGRMRSLPKGFIPMVGGVFGISPDSLPPFPYRAVWYSVLHADESLEEWLADYAEKSNSGTVRYLPNYNADRPKRATIRVEYLNPLPALPDLHPADEYRAFSSIQSEEKHTASVVQVGRVVFLAHFPEVGQLKLDAVAKRIQRVKSDWRFSLHPNGLPREELSKLIARVRQIAEPNLQQLDNESQSRYRIRTLGKRWLLDVLQFVTTDLKTMFVDVRGVLDQQEPFRVQVGLKAGKGTIHRVVGAPTMRRGTPQLTKPEWARRIAGFSYGGQVPVSFRDSLLKLVATVGDASVREAWTTILQQGELPLAVQFLQSEDQFVVVGALQSENASQLVSATARFLKQTGPVVSISLQESEPESESPKPKSAKHHDLLPSGPGTIAMTSKGDRLIFAIGDGRLEHILESATSTRSSNVFAALDLDLAALGKSNRSDTFAGWPAALLDLVEQQAFRLGARRATESSVWTLGLKLQLAEVDVPPDLQSTEHDAEAYLKDVTEYLRLRSPAFDTNTSRRAVLTEREAKLHFKASSTPDSLSFDMEVSREAYHFLVGQFYEAERTIEKSRSGP